MRILVSRADERRSWLNFEYFGNDCEILKKYRKEKMQGKNIVIMQSMIVKNANQAGKGITRGRP